MPAVVDRALGKSAERSGRVWRQRLPGVLMSGWFTGLALGVGAALLNLYRIGVPSLWFDEILSVERASQPLPVLWRIVNASQPNMALYYVVLHCWLALTTRIGIAPVEAVVRLPSALFALGGSIVLFLLARRFLGYAGGLLAALLYICNDFQLVYAQEARAYALQVFFLIAGWSALLMALTGEERRRLWFACYVCAMVLAVYTHYFSLLLLLAQGSAVITLRVLPTPWRECVRLRFRQWCVSCVLIVLLIVPMLYASHVGAQTGWIPVPAPGDVIRLLKVFGDDNRLYVLILVALLVSGLLAAAGARAGRFDLSVGFVWLLLCWLWVPIVVSYLLSQRVLHLFLPRYLISVLPAFCLLAACGFVAVPWRRLRVLLVPGLLLFTLSGIPHYYASAQVEEWRTAALWIEQQYRLSDGLICFDNLQGCQVGLEYYFHIYRGPAHFDADSPGTFSYVRYDLQRPAYRPDVEQALQKDAIGRYAARHARLFYIVARLPNARRQARAAAVISWLDGQYRLLGSRETSTVTVYLYRTARPGSSKKEKGAAAPMALVQEEPLLPPIRQRSWLAAHSACKSRSPYNTDGRRTKRCFPR